MNLSSVRRPVVDRSGLSRFPAFRLALLGLTLLVSLLAGVTRGQETWQPTHTLTLTTGDTLRGRQWMGDADGSEIAQGDGEVRWLVNESYQLVLPADLVSDIQPLPPLEEVDLEASSDAAADEAVETAEFVEEPRDAEPIQLTRLQRFRSSVENWTKRVELGGRMLSGNSDQQTLFLSGLFENTNDWRVLKIDVGGEYARSYGDPVANRWYGNGNIDFTKSDPWIVFISNKNEYDEIANLEYRGTLAGGLGYRFYNEKDRRLILRVGPAVTHERFSDPKNQRTTPDIMSELEVRWPLTDRLSFEQLSTFRPAVDDLNVFRLTSRMGLLWQITEDKTWSLKLGFLHDYNSRPNPGRKRSDITTSFLLVYQRD